MPLKRNAGEAVLILADAFPASESCVVILLNVSDPSLCCVDGCTNDTAPNYNPLATFPSNPAVLCLYAIGGDGGGNGLFDEEKFN